MLKATTIEGAWCADDISSGGEAMPTDARDTRTLKGKLRAGEAVYGTFSQLGSASTIDVLGASGFDFVVVDTEHAPYGRESMAALVRAAQG
jgi:2-keto-3-deoxy-L-rhamnonate aldolase RhmA